MEKKKGKASKEKEPIDSRIQKMSDKLTEIRKAKGYTSYESFAWDHDISRVQYWKMERGINFTMNSLLKILDAHKMSLKEFVDSLA